MKIRKERNWSSYNQQKKDCARVEFFISQKALDNWYYRGLQKPGGRKLYSDHAIELCLVFKEFYRLGYRQTEGFVDSVLKLKGHKVRVPEYTTLSRRASTLSVSIRSAITAKKTPLVVAVDSTGLSLYSGSDWNNLKHGGKRKKYSDRWHKLHIAIDVDSGEILSAKETDSRGRDNTELPGLLHDIPEKILEVSGDMAYDTFDCRKAIREKKAKQLIPPKRNATESKNSKDSKRKKEGEILKERDEAVRYMKFNEINGNRDMAHKSWKQKVGYHKRSLVETTMFQIKSYCSDHLTNRKEETRRTQAMIKCKVVNMMIAA